MGPETMKGNVASNQKRIKQWSAEYVQMYSEE